MRKQKWLSLLLCVAMVLTMLPVTVWAETGVFYLDENGVEQICVGTKEVTGDDTEWTTGWYVVNGEVNIGSSEAPQRITVNGDVHLILTDGGSLTVYGGIEVMDNDKDTANGSPNSLTIYCQTGQSGRLIAKSDPNAENQAGIGGTGGYVPCGSGIIVINGGNIQATAGQYAAGIGGGGANGTVIINGGTVEAITSWWSAYAIGGGANQQNSGAVIIQGGTVIARNTDSQYPSYSVALGGFSTGDGNSAIIYPYAGSCIADSADKTNWNCIIFEGDSATVYGNVTLVNDLEIPNGYTLTVPDGAELVIPDGVSMSNSGRIYVHGLLIGNAENAYLPLTVTGGTASPIYTYSGNTYGKAGETVTLTAESAGSAYRFEGWEASVDSVTVSDNAFTMPTSALTVEAKWSGPYAPTLSGFSITQGETPNSYTAKFTSDQAGTWYYTIDRKGNADTADLSGWISGTCVEGENTIILTDQIAGEKIHLAVVNQYGLCSTVTDEIENEHTALFNGLFAMYAPPIVNTPIYQHDAPSKETLKALLTERMNEYINSVFDYENRTEEEQEMLRTLASQMIVKQYVPAIAATADTDGANGSFIFEMEGSLCGWSSVAYLSDSDYEELDPTVIAEPYYSVTLNADGGIINSGNVTGYVYGVGATLPTDMTRWGYGFAGWYDDETGERVTAISNTDWGSRSFTARWALGGTAPTYTVTIPATVELGGTVTVSAEGVSLVEGSQLVVTLSGTNDTGNAFKLKTDEGAELSYNITKDGTALSVGGTVLTVAGGTANNSGSASLNFSNPTTAIRYSGTYKGAVIFTVSVKEVSTP